MQNGWALAAAALGALTLTTVVLGYRETSQRLDALESRVAALRAERPPLEPPGGQMTCSERQMLEEQIHALKQKQASDRSSGSHN